VAKSSPRIVAIASVMKLWSFIYPQLCSNQSPASKASGRVKFNPVLVSFSLSGAQAKSTGSDFTMIPREQSNVTCETIMTYSQDFILLFNEIGNWMFKYQDKKIIIIIIIIIIVI